MKNFINDPLVSVIINCFNSEKYLRETISSVLNQSYKHFEVILVDNCSIDTTKEIIFSFNDPRLKYFSTSKNLNLSSARNFALNKATGKYYAFLDSDDLWLENKLKIQVSFLEKNPNYGGLFSSCFLINESSKTIGTYIRKFENSPYTFKDLLKNYIVNFQTFIVRSKILDEKQIKFDDSLKLAEDIDFVLRLSYFSDLYCFEEFLAKYRIHENQDSFNYKTSFFDEEKYVLNKIFIDYSLELKDYFEEFTLYSMNCLIKNMNANQISTGAYTIKNQSNYNLILKKLFFVLHMPKFLKKIVLKILKKI